MAQANELRAQAAAEGKDVTPVSAHGTEIEGKVVRVVWNDKGPEEEAFDLHDPYVKPSTPEIKRLGDKKPAKTDDK